MDISIYDNQSNTNYIIKLKKKNIKWVDNNNFRYLYSFENSKIIKNIFITINLDKLKKFILKCLSSNYINNINTNNDFYNKIIILVDKLIKYNDNNEIRSSTIEYIGFILLNNNKYKNYNYLKLLEEFFINKYFSLNNRNYNYMELKYLIILINNIKKIIVSNNKIYNFDIIDYIFDYNIN